MTTQIFHRTATVKGRKIFYREAGDPSAPTILLLHGLPTSSQMFRDLMPALADRFHLIAPDYVGFGHSDAPSNKEFTYTFDNLADHVAGLVDVLGLKSYILYMQDYGGPVGFRLFTKSPEKVKGFIIQNANAYMEGVGDAPKGVLLPLWEKRTPETEKAPREFVGLEGTKFHWLVGAKDPEAINPDNWVLDQALLDRPGVQDYQVDLLENYKTNIASLSRMAGRVPFAQAEDLDHLGQERPVLHSARRARVPQRPSECQARLARCGTFRARRERAASGRRDQGRLRIILSATRTCRPSTAAVDLRRSWRNRMTCRWKP